MFWRAVLLLVLVTALSVALTLWFGDEVLIALGLILLQLKVIGQKIVSIELPAVLVWLKTQSRLFLRIELIKKWVMSSFVPLIMGSALRNRLEAIFAGFKVAAQDRYQRMMTWYSGLEWYEQLVAALIVILATLSLSVSSIGLWVILFSVKLPFMIAAGVGALWRMLWTTLAKWLFKLIAFLQLGWAWKWVERRLPESYLERKRRWDFRVARAVVRRRRMTLRQLHEQKHSLSMRLSLIAGYFRQKRPEMPEAEDRRQRDSSNSATSGPSNRATVPGASTVQSASPISSGSETTAHPDRDVDQR